MCDAIAATFISLAVTTATSVGMGISNGYAQAAQAQASMNMAAQQQQASIRIGNQQAMQQNNIARLQMQQQQAQLVSNQRLQLQQQAQQNRLSTSQQQQQLQQNAELQNQQQVLQIQQMQDSQRVQQQNLAESRNLQILQANNDLLDRYKAQRAAVINERGQLMKKNETDRKIYQSDLITAEMQKDENLSAANRVYISEQQKLNEKRKEAAFEAQAIMAKSIGAKGRILASGRTGQSVGLLVMDAERQAGFALAQEKAMLESAAVGSIIGIESAFDQNKSADRKADSSVGFNPEMPYLPSLPDVPTFVSLGIPK